MKILSVTEPDQEFGQHKHDCRLGEFMWVLAPAFPNSDFVADVAATASAENRMRATAGGTTMMASK